MVNTQVARTDIERGDTVHLVIGGGNRDPIVFSDPPHRYPNAQIGTSRTWVTAFGRSLSLFLKARPHSFIAALR